MVATRKRDVRVLVGGRYAKAPRAARLAAGTAQTTLAGGTISHSVGGAEIPDTAR